MTQQLSLFDVEQWRPIVGYEGAYEVSDQGRVRSVERTITQPVTRWGRPMTKRVPERILKPQRLNHGHLMVYLSSEGTRKRVLIHRLVLEAFIGPCPDGQQACHFNDIANDNRLINLRWDSPSANNHDIVRNGNHHNANKTHCKRGHEFTPENTYARSGGGRHCVTCTRESATASYRRRRAA
jgi:NUMOD4 motif/HNH endonuclease